MQRRTQQRRAIREAIEAADRPLSPQEILDAAQEEVPGLGIATVYRNVKHMVEDGVLHTVELPGGPSRYEAAGKHHHHHFHCRRCDRVFEVEDCPGSLQGLTPDGFLLESHEIILYGLCSGCGEVS
jgi:Fur family ferric uptake transcriptional regulator